MTIMEVPSEGMTQACDEATFFPRILNKNRKLPGRRLDASAMTKDPTPDAMRKVVVEVEGEQKQMTARPAWAAYLARSWCLRKAAVLAGRHSC